MAPRPDPRRPPRPGHPRGGGAVKMSTFSGDQIAQVNNPDPFAPPVWRSPVYHTPGWIITIVQAWRLLEAIVGFLLRHPLLDVAAAVIVVRGLNLAWPGLILVAAVVLVTLVAWRWRWPAGFSRFITRPVLGKWRRWHYQRHWAAVMTIGRLAPAYQGRLLLPVLGRVSSTRFTDRVAVRLVSGQSSADFAARGEPGPRVRRHHLPRPHRQARIRGPGTGPPRRPRRHHPRPAPAPACEPAGAAGRAPGGRVTVAGPGARHARADRRGHRRRESLDHLVPHPRHAQRHAAQPGPRP